MQKFAQIRLKPILLVFTALLLLAAIPAGYMPAAAGSGLLFEFCPEGVPAEFMQVLSGDEHHDHGQMGHEGMDHDDHHCPVGHMLLSAAAVDDHWHAEAASAAPTLASYPLYTYESALRTSYLTRGPPA
jgi:hypothetical protein